MTGWLRSNDRDRRRGSRPDASAYVPRSVKAPEAQRFAPADLQEIEDIEQDADLQLLRALAAQSGATQHPAEPRDATDARHLERQARDGDDLRHFRESRLLVPRRVPPALGLAPDVEIADLVEDLSTTAAALRRLKKAA